MKKIFSLLILSMFYSISSLRAQCTILGPEHMCAGAVVTYGLDSTCTPGGFWTSFNTGIATIGSTSGILTAVSPGVDTISYYRPGLGGPSFKVITVNPSPTMSGIDSVCVGGASVTWTASPMGGTWTSSCPTLISITSAGVITGLGLGSCNITYTAPGGCISHRSIRAVNCGVDIDSIHGPNRACVGSIVTFTDATPGGTWSSSDPTKVSINPTTGVASVLSAGVVTISYTIGTSSRTFTFAAVGAPTISGLHTVCVGNTITLTSSGSGGSWSSSSPSIASVSAAGIVTGIAVGTATITYTLDGCLSTHTVTVNPSPAAIGGPTTVGVASSITLTDATAGGVWSSSSSSIALINSTTGSVTGISPGVANIYYTVAGCSATRTLTVTATSGSILPISGSASTCVGASTLFTDATPGGTWSSSSPSIASVTSTGLVTGMSAGTATITYTVGSGFVTKSITVYTSATISGTALICVGGTSTLTGSPAGGTWTSSNTAIATVGSSSGVVTGVAAGTATIYYISSGCSTYRVVTVTPLPAAISGIATTTVGGTSTLSDATAGGTWSSSNTSIATISSTGVVTGISAGSCTITYTLPSGCFRTITFSVTPGTVSIGVINGPSTVCVGTTITLTDTTAGGTWSSSNPSVATVSSTGVVTGISAGSATITYTVGSSFVTKLITVTSSASISGPSTVCVGNTISLAGSPAGGTWTSSAPTMASVTSTGLVSGLAAGVVTITYTAGGCTATKLITVSPAPAAISGTATTSIGSTSTLTDATPGGTWTSSNTSIATVGVSTGIVTGVASGICTITYTLPSGCYRTITFTVTGGSTTISPITGASGVCVGSTIALADSTPGGTWSSSNPSVATVSSTGVVTGISTGTAVITYTVGSSFVTKTITVSSSATISGGGGTICIGSTVTLTGSPAGGTWVSSSPSIATVTSAGVVTGMSAGTVNIYYTSGGCSAFTTVTVIGSAVITGSSSLCVGSTASMSATPSGGTWSSSNPSIATVTSTGMVSAISTGVVNIYYSTGGCYTYKSVTVNASAAISGSSSVCVGSTITLTSTVGGGTWSSSDTSKAQVNSSGIVTGISAGTVVITYNNGGCSAVKTITVAAGGTISGISSICLGSVYTFAGSPSGGTWSSSNTAIATISTAGVVTAVSAGVVTISYNTGSSCIATRTVTVSAAATISGSSSVCVGSSITLTATTSGGYWYSSDSSKAVVSSSGVVTGTGTGSVTIYYSVGGCTSSKVITITPGALISGGSALCVGSTMSLSATPTGGFWTSSNPSVASVSSTGLVVGAGVGVASITYTPTSGCAAVRIVTVTAGAAISGSSTVCTGSSVTLTATVGGGTWSSSNTARATVNSAGVVTGISTGAVTISYTIGGCTATKAMTVNAIYIAGGDTTMCSGATMSLTAGPTGGTWSSSAPTIASVSSTGLVTAFGTGFVTISYAAGGCVATRVISISSGASISGGSTVCAGSTLALSASPLGGSWSSSSSAIATVSSSGIVTGMSAGTVTITYAFGTCVATKVITVTSGATISGSTSMCLSATITLAATPTGGTWASSNPSVATVSSTGVVTGFAAGLVNITYSLAGGCSAVRTITVNGTSVITGSSAICIGTSTSLSATPGGGTWSSGAPSVAAISSTGVVTGVTAGVVNIYYMAGGCYATKTMTITPTPVISGTPTMCVGSTTALTATPAGGSWTSSASTIASVSASGVVTGMAAGTAVITYSVGSCFATRTVTVTPGSSTISGGSAVCIGSTLALTGSPAGGTWASGYTGIATVSSTGVVSGVGVGTVTVYYSVGGCYAYRSVTVSPVPSPIVGPTGICVGASATLTDATAGGTWSSSNPLIASVASTGLVSGISSGLATMSYTVGGCSVTRALAVNPTPAPITGGSTVTVGGTLLLSDATPGGTWTSANPSKATVMPTTGVVRGVSLGTVNINYAIGACSVFKTISVVAPFAAISPSSAELTMPAEAGGSSVAAKGTAPNGTQTLQSGASVSVFPNPTSGTLNVKWDNQETGNGTVTVSDIIGREVYHTALNITETSGQTQLFLNDLKDGIYMMTIKSGSIHYSARLIIRQ